MEMLKRALFLLMLTMPLTAVGGRLLVADAGGDQHVFEGESVELHGEGRSRFPWLQRFMTVTYSEGGFRFPWLQRFMTVTYSWEQTAGTQVALDGANTAEPSFVAPQLSGLENEVLSFQLTVSASFGRGDDDDDDGDDGGITLTDTDIVDIIVGPALATITGRVTNVAGDVIGEANIDVLLDGSSLQSSVSDDFGNFGLDVPRDAEYVLQFTADGYAARTLPVKSPAADQSVVLEVTMIPRGDPETFSGSAGAVLTGTDGAIVRVSANSFVDADGSTVTGDIEVTITPVDVSHSASLAAFPGEFLGDTGASIEPIISFGAGEYEFTLNGEPIQLATGETADIEIPIYFSTYQDGTPVFAGDDNTPPDVIPLWSLDEDTGIWTQEGSGTVVASADSPTGLALAAEVSHFSWWNSSVTMNAAQAIVTVVGTDSGTALVRARTTADIGWQPSTVDTVASVGVPTSPLDIPSTGEVCFWAEINYTDGSSATTSEECVNAEPDSLVNVDLVAPAEGPLSITTLPAATAGVLDVAGYIDFPVDPVGLRPTTIETTVSYSIVSGALPPGVSLNTVNATRAEMTGIPTAAGNFTATVEGTDADGTTDSVIVNYTVSTDAAPPAAPELDELIQIEYRTRSVLTEPLTVNLSNTGGPITGWSVEPDPSPVTMALDTETGSLLLTIPEAATCISYSGNLTATNGGGSSVASLSIDDTECN